MWLHHPWVSGELGCCIYFFMHMVNTYTTVHSVAGPSTKHCLALCQPLRASHLLTSDRPCTLLFPSGRLAWPGLAPPMAVIVGQKQELKAVDGVPKPASRWHPVLVTPAMVQVFIQIRGRREQAPMFSPLILRPPRKLGLHFPG